jgi:chromosome segregation protein
VYLKKLSLLGFKSFPEATDVEFGPGMTGIVGPNGCGKTNILDALRWVLGEQRTTLLRGSKMEEVIFNGSRDAKPLGMSEVSLTIANSRGVLPTEYTDLTITRRLYRSGESEYRLNKQPCRLRDILDLFADTGMGAHAYSVIQQDMIDAILSDKAEDRRFLFEEAAGITKYKHRKKAALRKLEATEADLIRLKDIAAEVRTRVISLKRQSAKAERYKEFKDRWEQLHLRLARSDYDSLQQRALMQETRASNLKADLEAARAQVTAREAERETLQAEVEETERGVDIAGRRVADFSEQLHIAETEWEKLSAQRQASATRQRELVHEIEMLASQRRDRERRIAELTAERVQVEVEAGTAREEADRQFKVRETAEAAFLSARQAQIDAAGEAEAARERCRILDSERVHIEETMTDTGRSLGQSQEVLQRANAESIAAAAARAAGDADEETARTAHTAAEQALTEMRTRRDQAEDAQGLIEAELKVSETHLTELESQRQILGSWVETYRGYHGAVPELLTRNRPVGLADTVAQLIRVEPGYEVPVAAALAERTEYLVCRDRSTAQELLRRLEDSDVGRAHLIVSDALGDVPQRPAPGEHMQPLVEKVSVRGGFEALGRFLLADFFLWTGDGEPNVSELPRDTALITRTGRLYRGQAEAAAGRSEAVSLLARKQELERLEASVHAQTGAVNELRSRVAHLAEDLAAARRAVVEAEIALANAQAVYRTAGLEAERARAHAEATERDAVRHAETCRTFALRLQESTARIAQVKSDLTREQTMSAARQLALECANAELEHAEQARTDAMLKAGEAQVHAVSMRGRFDGLTSDRERTREMLADIQNRTAAQVTALLELGRKRRESTERMQETLARKAELTKAKAQAQETYNHARDAAASRATSLHDLDLLVKAARKQFDTTSTNHHEAEMAASEARLEVVSLVERIRESHNVELSERTDFEAVDPNQRGLLTAEARELKERLDAMGTVNLLALDEYAEQKQRLDFLDNQLADLESAKKTLGETIEKINATARDLFHETFATVQENFNLLFTQLFEGGEAAVFLDLPDDPLESPISVTARPRGKRPVSILQLSGGERALTAIALLFSLYMVKPSPFCILDEIDAPLDDANIGRFLTLLSRFSTNTQFIVITHNKMTMQATDVLYGVTMQSPGISKVVSVQLNEAVEVAAL